MQPLPIDAFLPRIVQLLGERPNLVLVAEPGAGKTTRVPPAVLPLLDCSRHRNLVMLQPRRVAARAAAARIAQERGWKLGNEVGYHVRFDRVIGADTRLRVLTEGILTRQLLDDAFLEGVGCVVLDEFHERSIHIDLAIALLREVQQTVRPDLKLIVMSATLDAEPVAAFLGDAPVVRVPGRLFPIEIEHRPRRNDCDLEDQIVDEIHALLREDDDRGDVLVFLPGAGEINRTQAAIEAFARESDAIALPLHGSLRNDEQLRALEPSKQRKVILATNIAETSLTIDGVTHVIDSGLHRTAGYDARRGMDTLTLQRISQASAAQRAGRAGRTAPGRAVRVWSAKEHNELAPFEEPEIARVDLAATVLALHAWGCDDPRHFAFFQPPPEHMLASAQRLLAMLDALDAPQNGRITALGRRMLRFPAHPRLARLLLAADDAGLRSRGALIAALLSEKDILRESRDDPFGGAVRADSDIDLRLELLDNRRLDDRIDRGALSRVKQAAEQYRSPSLYAAREAPNRAPTTPGVGELVLLAYPDRVCRMRDKVRRTGTMVGGGGVKLAAESAVVDADFFVAVEARHNPNAARGESLVQIASKIQREWLEALFPGAVRRETSAEFDQSRQRVVGVARMYYHDLLLDEQANVAVDDASALRALIEALAPRAAELIASDEHLSGLWKRLTILEHALPAHLWPRDHRMGDKLNECSLLADACIGARSLDDVRRRLRDSAEARLTHADHRLLAEHAPESITVPTGNRIRLDWSAAGIEPLRGPKLSVRLQELFGLSALPRICGGAVAIALELLGPNYRPVQITDDLASFWKNTYPQVRKDLRARYPKHSWPEDPLTAPPQAKGRSTRK